MIKMLLNMILTLMICLCANVYACSIGLISVGYGGWVDGPTGADCIDSLARNGANSVQSETHAYADQQYELLENKLNKKLDEIEKALVTENEIRNEIATQAIIDSLQVYIDKSLKQKLMDTSINDLLLESIIKQIKSLKTGTIGAQTNLPKNSFYINSIDLIHSDNFLVLKITPTTNYIENCEDQNGEAAPIYIDLISNGADTLIAQTMTAFSQAKLIKIESLDYVEPNTGQYAGCRLNKISINNNI